VRILATNVVAQLSNRFAAPCSHNGIFMNRLVAAGAQMNRAVATNVASLGEATRESNGWPARASVW
jgi:hypothetical protein